MRWCSASLSSYWPLSCGLGWIRTTTARPLERRLKPFRQISSAPSRRHEHRQPRHVRAEQTAACKLLDQRTAVQLGLGRNNNRRCLRYFFTAIDYHLLGGARADHRSSLRRRRVAQRKRQRRAPAADMDPSSALGSFHGGDEHDAAAHRPKKLQRECRWLSYFHLAGTWYLYGRRAHSIVASLPSRTGH